MPRRQTSVDEVMSPAGRDSWAGEWASGNEKVGTGRIGFSQRGLTTMSLTTFWRWAYSEIQSISVSGTYNTVTEQILFCRRFWKLGHFTHAYVLSTAATANPTDLLIYIYIFITIITKYARKFLVPLPTTKQKWKWSSFIQYIIPFKHSLSNYNALLSVRLLAFGIINSHFSSSSQAWTCP